MQICLHSGQFFPVVGGIAQVSYTLAKCWHQLGHTVTIVTDTPSDQPDAQEAFPVLRCPTVAQWKELLSSSDVIVANGYSLRHIVPWLRSGKPIIWIHPIYIADLFQPNLSPWQNSLRPLLGRLLLPLAACHVYVSQAIAQHIRAPRGVVIYNPVEDRFRPLPDVAIENDFAFFGRMDSEKGVDTLLEALAICTRQGKCYRVDLYGQGPVLQQWQELARSLGIEPQLRWFPFARGEDLVRAMNAAGAVIVPSRWAEPMGVVAVEAMACGKAVIGSRQGGLGEVLEGYALTFDNGNADQLAECMIQLHDSPDLRQQLEKKAYLRSQDFAATVVAERYLTLFKQILRR